jgi:tripeptide aminopeptidase
VEKLPVKYRNLTTGRGFGDASAILNLNEVINKINDIRLPKRPRTSIVMGSIEGGTTFNTIALESTLGFEVRSESQDVVDEIGERIEEIGIEVSSKMGDHVNVDIFARQKPWRH